ncbi:pyridoxamine 5'-phosphate oxidase [Chthoniobacter flavus Ellin428]|uniref:Pyridoxamine 5'-phosphate oxidase n=1 Tax=Chthoniobacter flavus Ellin428 TaxID=497964 RepID=B4CV41_9BACT|nr:pyridoxamine 5'-phosphate oxidase [Chthoniobacter flavus]EDY22429.1 pyridoxamine 5'-phosphate oxidase [Chthoniobacter flavus Ellin428]TCO94561.1 pyridoxamine 5'-phosphate oxidase [Chthoniobacter flavus]
MLSPAELAALRQDYAQRGLRRSDLDPDPIKQFNAWLNEAVDHQLLEPNAMTVASVDATGQPWTRTVLLKICDDRGFTFFTNYDGAKGRHFAANPKVALTFWWNALERQVNVTGKVVKSSAEESAAYFHTRPEASQVGAWASTQSEVIADRAQLERQFAEARERFGQGQIPLPPHWGGYCVVPETIEFWQGRRSRLHDRLRYTREPDGGWQIERLSP